MWNETRNQTPVAGAGVTLESPFVGAADVPAPIKSAIGQTVTWLYEHRGGDAAPMPQAALALLAPYRAVCL